jgi:hypothetical protein
MNSPAVLKCSYLFIQSFECLTELVPKCLGIQVLNILINKYVSSDREEMATTAAGTSEDALV